MQSLPVPDPAPIAHHRKITMVKGHYACDFIVSGWHKENGRTILKLKLVPGSCTYVITKRKRYG